MRLAEFLASSQQDVIADSLQFAARIPALSGSAITVEILRDHLPLILEVIVADLQRPQTRAESILKSEGDGPQPADDSPAQMHGKVRAIGGLTIEQLVAEYRVLRSSVLRLWSESAAPDEFAAEDVLRFNEAIDQAVAESVAFFHAEVEHWRALMLGVVGHDLRGPLNGMLLTAEVLIHDARNTPFVEHAQGIARGAKRMGALLDSLLEYNKASLGIGMILHRAPGDLVRACKDELLLLRASLPVSEITFTSPPACHANLDFSRIREALANLVFNAAQHGIPGSPIQVVLEKSPGTVRLSVQNAASPIDPAILFGLFEPLRQRAQHRSGRESRNLGLGLFIVRTIARAHGGDATVDTPEGQVRFSIALPTDRPAG